MLVADDDRGMRISTVAILKTSGYSVSEAEDGVVALAALAGSEIDAVILDVKMPRKDGISVLEDMVPQPPPPGVLLVSAYDIEHETRLLIGRRVHKVLRKPVPPPLLIEAVAEAVEVAKAARSA